MPIRIQNDLPVKEILENENIFVMDEYRATHQDIRPLQVGILNLMPIKQDTELHLLRSMSNTPLQVDITFIKLNSHVSMHTSATHLNKFYVTFDEIKELADKNRIAATIYKMCDVYITHCRDRMKLPGLAMHDSLPVAWLINPDLVKSEDYYVTADINGRHTYGMTVTDVHRTLNEKPNVTVALDVDRLAFIKLIEDAFEALS